MSEQTQKPLNALDRYQVAATRTGNKDLDVKQQLTNYALGITGEGGEVADIIKKHVFHGHPLDIPELEKELGDVIWYIANLADVIGVSLSQIAIKNIEKLNKRYADGFSEEASKERTE